MDKTGFRKFLETRGIAAELIEPYVSLAEKFERFLAGQQPSRDAGTADADLVNAFSSVLIKEKLNILDNYRALILYGRFVKNNAIIVAAIELADGAEALGNLYDKLGAELGEPERDRIFDGVTLPPLGAPNREKPGPTRVVMERLEQSVGADGCKRLLGDSIRTLQDAWYAGVREKYLESGGVDAFLERRKRDFIAELERLRDTGELYFTQPIDDEVIDFVRSHPEISRGVREGNTIYEIKIPYMTKEWLAEPDEEKKRYYYCHCPWARESLRPGHQPVPAAFCNCSAGFTKRVWEVALDRPLTADVVESVLKGDRWCRIAVHLPENIPD